MVAGAINIVVSVHVPNPNPRCSYGPDLLALHTGSCMLNHCMLHIKVEERVSGTSQKTLVLGPPR